MADDLRTRALEAAHDCIARVGVAKTSLDDVAREAGCSRATLYRHFSGKAELLEALVRREIDRFDAALAAAAAAADDLADACARVVVEGATFVLDHPALGTVLAVEPALVLPVLSLGSDDFLADAARRVGRHLGVHLADADAAEADRLGELVVRITLSHLHSPDPERSITDPQVARTLVHQYIVPGFVEPATGRNLA